MTSILRKIVAGPRINHAETGLDLCYVTDNIIATSGPSIRYPQLAYRNPLKALVRFLDEKHGDQWAIWEFRAEGTGYADDEVYGRIWHYPWPDHHPPPFQLIPGIMASMREWLSGSAERVVVVHCKAGKGRSGTVACAYLISEEGWEPAAALARFTERRMRPASGPGVSIASQLRWVDYVGRWTRNGKVYVDRPVEVLEVHVWGLKDGVKVAVEGYIDDGRAIKTFHVFGQDERIVMGEQEGTDAAETADGSGRLSQVIGSLQGRSATGSLLSGGGSGKNRSSPSSPRLGPVPSRTAAKPDMAQGTSTPGSEPGGAAVLFRPRPPARILLPSSDINLAVERRVSSYQPGSSRWQLVTAVAHVWFNAYFEGQMPASRPAPDEGTAEGSRGAGGQKDNPASAASAAEGRGKGQPVREMRQEPDAPESGAFEASWEAMDGIKGSSKRGTRALDRVAVVWRFVPPEDGSGKPVTTGTIRPRDSGEGGGAGSDAGATKRTGEIMPDAKVPEADGQTGVRPPAAATAVATAAAATAAATAVAAAVSAGGLEFEHVPRLDLTAADEAKLAKMHGKAPADLQGLGSSSKDAGDHGLPRDLGVEMQDASSSSPAMS